MAKTKIMYPFWNVWSQGDRPFCLAFALADMMTIIYRMFGHMSLVLSPQILIDHGCTTWFAARKIVTDSEQGLQSIQDYPFHIDKTENPNVEYQPGFRYCLDKICVYYLPQSIRREIQSNFSEMGANFPLGVGIQMGDFDQPSVAFAAWTTPFRHPLGDKEYSDRLEKEPLHAMLIVAADFSSTDEREHFCVVKNSHSEHWGYNGFSKIFVDMVTQLCVPVLEKEKIFHEGWKKDGTDN